MTIAAWAESPQNRTTLAGGRASTLAEFAAVMPLVSDAVRDEVARRAGLNGIGEDAWALACQTVRSRALASGTTTTAPRPRLVAVPATQPDNNDADPFRGLPTY